MSVTEPGDEVVVGDGDVVGLDPGVNEYVGDTGVSNVDVGVRLVVGVALGDWEVELQPL